MKRRLPVSMFALLTLVLSACTLFPFVGGPQVSGNITGTWPEGASIALVGLTTEGNANYANQTRIVDPTIADGYIIAVPATAAEGVYQIVAFQDTNEDSLFEESESIGNSGTHLLAYSKTDSEINFGGSTFVVRKGWNGFTSDTPLNTDGNPYQAEFYGNYDLILSQ
jgi:hypothetical protein